MLNVAIRADGSQNIGMGHIVRCISLARELTKKNCQVLFISREDLGIERIVSEEFKVVLPRQQDSYTRLDREINEITKMINENSVDVLIIDTYNISEEYFIRLKEQVKVLVYIDDINKFSYSVDILINGNINGAALDYDRSNKKIIFLLGTKYNLIRSEFKNLKVRKLKKHVKNVLITTGGSDPYNLCVKITELLVNYSRELNIKIIVGNAFKNKEQLYNLAETYPMITLYENPNRISEIMLSSDIAISSGGSTLYELCTCGIPCICFIMAENQEGIVGKMAELGLVLSLGHYSLIENNLLKKLKMLIENFDLRMKMSDASRKLVDAFGAERVAEEIIKYAIMKIEGVKYYERGIN